MDMQCKCDAAALGASISMRLNGSAAVPRCTAPVPVPLLRHAGFRCSCTASAVVLEIGHDQIHSALLYSKALKLSRSLPPAGLALKTSCISICSSVMEVSTVASNRRKKAAVNLLSSILARLVVLRLASLTHARTGTEHLLGANT